MRLYAFVNYYLSPLQHGLQTAHLVSELFAQHLIGSELNCQVGKWALYHKTIIILKGGNSKEIADFYAGRLFPLRDKFPTAIFYEDHQSLNGAATAAGIILPEELYDAQPGVCTSLEGFDEKFELPFIHTADPAKGGQVTITTPKTPEWYLLNDLSSFKLA